MNNDFDWDEFKDKIQFAVTEMNNEYPEMATEFMKNLDFKKFGELKKKSLVELTEADLEFIGLEKAYDDRLPELYNYRDLNGIKIYLNKLKNFFELRGFELKKTGEIHSTTELLEETLLKWKLKIDETGYKLNF